MAWIGLGANLGDPPATLTAALQALDRLPATRVQRVSSLYRSAPVAASGPDFVNAVATLSTGQEPEALMRLLLDIERSFGRQRPYPNAPRLLDLDLLLYDELHCRSSLLELPHPRMHARAFVLAPLAELAPDRTVGAHGSAAQLLAACGDQPVQRIAPPPALEASHGVT